MQLDNYTPFEKEFVEEWGVETNGTGAATCRFDQPSGIFDIRITYFDETDGQSHVTLFVAGREEAVFTLNEDVDCWRWRRFEDIQVNRGDEIKLVGQADRDERARLDFVEFIPCK